MKRKIAAILAADIAGYSRLVAEDEEETLRRLASYRSVTDDFIARSGGRIFCTGCCWGCSRFRRTGRQATKTDRLSHAERLQQPWVCGLL